MASRTVPTWALQHLRDHEPEIGQVLNVRRHARRVVLANTRFGAVVVSRTAFGPVVHQFLSSPREHTRFDCPACKQPLEFRALPLPANVHCGRCGQQIHLDAFGRPGAPFNPVGHVAIAPARGNSAAPPPRPDVAQLAREVYEDTRARAGGSPAGDGEATIRRVRAAAQSRADAYGLTALAHPAAGGQQTGPQQGAPTEGGDVLALMKSTFINSAAHELQTPMTPLLLSLRTLEMAAPGTSQEQTVRQAVRNAKRLEDVIANVVRVAQVQADGIRVTPSPCDVRSIADTVAQAWMPRFDAAGVRLRVLGVRRAPVQADEARLRELLGHLLSNALRFSEPGGAVAVTLRRGPSSVAIDVADEGVGIAAQDQARIFEPFVQLEAARFQTEGGLGLGLFFARAVATAHDGTLSVHSAGPGTGACFTAQMPVAGPAAGASPSNPSQRTPP